MIRGTNESEVRLRIVLMLTSLPEDGRGESSTRFVQRCRRLVAHKLIISVVRPSAPFRPPIRDDFDRRRCTLERTARWVSRRAFRASTPWWTAWMSLALAYAAIEADLWPSRVDYSQSEGHEATNGRLHWGLYVVGPSASLVLPLVIYCNIPLDWWRTSELSLLPIESTDTDGCALIIEAGTRTIWWHLIRASTVWVDRQVTLQGSASG